MPTYTVGAGKTYDSADGILQALNAIPTNFAGETEDHIIEVYPGYEYTHSMTTKKVMTNTASNKKLIIRPATGYEHKGDFTAGIVIKKTDTLRLFYFQGNYIEVYGFRWVVDGSGNINQYLVHFNGDSNYCNVSNNLFYVDTTNISPTSNQIYLMWADGGTFENAKINNNLGVSKVDTGVKVMFLTCDSSSLSGTKVNNCLSFDMYWHYYLNNKVVEINNCGRYGSGTFGELTTNATGNNNYGNPASGIGSNYLSITQANSSFIDTTNNKFYLKTTSTLIGSGYNSTADNPTDIRGNIWQGYHRSPFNHTVITNAFMQPPEDTEYVRGAWMSGLVFNCVQPGGKVSVGDKVSAEPYSDVGYDYAGFSTKCTKITRFHSLVRPINTKFLTVSALIKRSGASGADSYSIGKNGETLGLAIDTSASNRIRFKASGTYYGESTSLTSYVNVNQWFNAIAQVNLQESTDANRVKIYLYQKGFLSKVTLTFTGTAPTNINLGVGDWLVGYHDDYQGITSMWDRLLSFEELYNIAYDPYVIYRSDKKLFRLTNVIPEGQDNLWFLRKFIMDKRQLCY